MCIHKPHEFNDPLALLILKRTTGRYTPDSTANTVNNYFCSSRVKIETTGNVERFWKTSQFTPLCTPGVFVISAIDIFLTCEQSPFLSCVQVTDDPSEVAKRAPPRNSPRFAGFMNAGGESSYVIFVEQKVLCHISSFTKALILWFSIHYIFNLEYCKQAKDVALFFQECVFRLPDRSKKSATYLTVCSDIQSYAS